MEYGVWEDGVLYASKRIAGGSHCGVYAGFCTYASLIISLFFFFCRNFNY